MSKTVDQRVVEMRFDNKQFESNVSTTMSSLDKLKQKLNFSGATKGLENVGEAANKVNMNGLSGAVDTVRMRFSALEVMGVTALTNITNQAVNAGKRLISAFTIDPVKTGFQEYELKMGSVQTIMASTNESLETVNKYLEELNKYSDQTIYSFSDMTNNIGKFTNAGVKLEDAVMAIKGISNEAALSGANANEASRAMYNFSQALSSGYVKLIDWKSIENANMATAKFKQQLIDTAVELGTVTKASDGMYETLEGNAFNNIQNFNEVLQDQWMTSEVLIETLKKYADENTDIGKKAKAAAQDVKTFTMMMDTLKEAAQSGWAKTWELIIGDFEEAKSLFTNLSNFFGNIIEKVSDFRNNILEGALGRGFTSLKNSFSSVMNPVTETMSAITGVTRSLAEHEAVVDEVIHGKWGHMWTRWNALTEAGYDWVHVQNLVNERLGSSVRRTSDFTESLKKQNSSQSELSKTEANRIAQLAEMSDEQLKNLGYTKEQIKAFRDLKEIADKLGIPLQEFIEKLDEINGRWLLLKSFENVGNSLIQVFNAIKDAWQAIFPPKTTEEHSNQLFNIIAAIHKFSRELIMNDDQVKNLKKTFEGLFALLDIILTVIGGPIKIVLKIVKQLLSAFNIDILSATAFIGDIIVKFRDWIDSVLDFSGAFEKIAPYVTDAIRSVKEWFNANVNLSEGFNTVSTFITDCVNSIREWIESLKKSENLPKDIADGIIKGFGKAVEFISNILSNLWQSLVNGFSGTPNDLISGFVNGIWNGIKTIGSVIVELAKGILEKFREVLGIHSPSTETHSDGQNFILGFFNGIKEFVVSVLEYIKSFADDCLSALDLDWNKVFSGLLGAGIVYSLVKIGKAISTIIAPFERLNDIFKATAGVIYRAEKVMKTFQGTLKSLSMNLKAKALQSIAVALLMLVGAVVVLTFIPSEKLWPAVEALAAIGGILAVLTAVLLGMVALLAKFEKEAGGTEKVILKVIILISAVAGALTSLALIAKMLSGVNWEDIGKLGAIAGGLLIFILALVAISKLIKGYSLYDLVPAMLAIAGVMFVLSLVAKQISSMSWNDLGRAGAGITGLAAIIVGLIAATRLAGGSAIKEIGVTLMAIAGAISILAIVAKIIAGMNWDEMGRAGVGITALTIFIVGLMAATRLIASGYGGAASIAKIGPTILKISAGILVLAVAAKLLATMSWDDLGRAGAALVGLTIIISLLIAATRLAGDKELIRVGSTLIALSIAIGILAGIAVLLGLIDPIALLKGVGAIAALGIIMAGMIVATKFAQDSVKNIIVMTIAIAVMVAAVAGLSLLDTKNVLIATGCIAALMGMFALLLVVTSKASKSIAPLIVMTIAIALLAGAIYLIGQLEPSTAISSAASLGLLMLSLAATLLIVSIVGKNATGMIVGVLGLLAICGVLAMLVGILMGMSEIQNATSNIIALSAMLMAMTVVLLLVSVAGSLGAGAGALIGVLGLLAICGVLAILVAVIRGMQDIKDADKNINLLTGMLTVIGELLFKLALVGPFALIASIALAMLTGVMVALGVLAVAIGYLMTQCPELEDFLNKGLPILDKLAYGIGSMIGNFIAGFSEAIMGILPKLGECLSQFMYNIIPFIAIAKMVDDKVLAGVGYLTAAIMALTVAEFMAGIASIFGLSLIALGAELTGFMIAAYPFFTMASKIKPEVVDSVKSIAGAILALTAANVLDGIAKIFGMESSLSKFGKELEDFGPHLAKFAESVSGLSSESLAAMKTSAEAGKLLADMGAALPKEGGLIGDIFGEAKPKEFGEQMAAFGEAIVKYADSVEGLKTDAIKASIEPAKGLVEVANSMPKTDGIWQDIIGQTDIEKFGEQLVSFGGALVDYANIVENLKTNPISNSIEPANDLIEVANSMPKTGGIWQDIVGQTDMKVFGKKLKSFGKSLKDYGTNVDGLKIDKIKASIKAAEALSDLSAAITDKNGTNIIERIGQIFTGDGMTNFINGLPKLGEGMTDFSDSVKDVNPSKIVSAAKAAKNLSEVAISIKDYTDGKLFIFGSDLAGLGGKLWDYNKAIKDLNLEKIEESAEVSKTLTNMASTIPSNVDVYKFGSDIAGFGGKLYDFNNHVKDLNFDNIRSSATVGRALAGMAKSIPKNSEAYIFGSDIAGFGGKLYDFNDHVKNLNIEKINTAITASNALIEMAKSITDENSATLRSFGDSLRNLGNVSVKNFIESFEESGTKIIAAGKNLINNFIKGVKVRTIPVKNSFRSMLNSVISTIKEYGSKFYDAGTYLVSEFCSGITQHIFMAKLVARAMTRAAANAAANELEEESPSKVGYKIGDFFGIAFVNAIGDYATKAYSAGSDMASSAKAGLSNTISKIKDAMDSDIDVNPTIRPVLDLTNIKDGANAINGMLGLNPSIGTITNAGIINSMMNNKNQNGVNGDMVSAINKLRDDLSNMPRNTYSIGNINYEEGTDVADAIKTIVKAAIVERRK